MSSLSELPAIIAEERFRAIFEHSLDGLVLLDAAGMVRYASPSTRRILGDPVDGFEGRSAFSKVHPQDLARVRREFERMLQDPQGSMTAQFRCHHEDGKWRWVDAVGSNLLAVVGVEAVVVSFRDITEAKRAEISRGILAELSAVLGSSLSFEDTLHNLARRVVSCCADFCVIDLMDAAGTPQRVTVVFADTGQEHQFAALEKQYPPSLENGLLALALQHGEPVLVSEVTDPILDRLAYNTEHRNWLSQLSITSFIVAPLRARGRVLGAITLGSTDGERSYDSIDLDMAEELAERAALALDNARLYEEARQSAEQLTLLAAASNTLLPTADPDAVLPALLELAVRLIPANAYAIWKWNPGNGTWTIEAERNLPADYTRLVTAAGDTLPSAPLLVEDVLTSPLVAHRLPIYAAAGIRAMLCAPLHVAGRGIGSITFYFEQPHPLSEPEIRIATALASLAATALNTAELYAEQHRLRRETERAREGEAFLAEASRILASSLDYETTLRHVARQVVPRLADWCTVHLVEEAGSVRQVVVTHADPEKLRWVQELPQYPYDPDATHGVPQVIRTGLTERHHEITDELLVRAAQDEEHLKILRQWGLSSVMVVPLQVREQVLGAITFASAESGYLYTEDDQRLAENLAGRAAGAIDHARLFRDAQETLQRLAESERRFRRLADANILGVCFADAEGRLTDANEAFLRMAGYGRDELCAGALRWDGLTHSGERMPGMRGIGEDHDGSVWAPQECELVRKDGTLISVLTTGARSTGSQTEGIAFVMDLSEKKRVENDLHYVMEHARCLLYHAVVTPSANGRTFSWNFSYFDEQAAQRFLPLELLPGETYLHAFYRNKPEEDRRFCDQNAHSAFREDKPFYRQEVRCRRADGEIRWLYEEVQLEKIAPQRWRAVGFCTDVTERKNLEGELRRQMEALELADHRKDQFLAMLAHELRNPLGAISNALHVLRAEQAGEETRDRALAILERQVRHQRRMVDDLLDVSRITRGLMEIRKEPVDMLRLARETADDHRAEFQRKGVALETEFPGGTAWVLGDNTRLEQVVGNLLHNARKFTDPGGTVRIAAEIDSDASRLSVSVSDNGIGLPVELLPHVFESFIQGDQSLARARGGLGLGLALARGLIELHEGAIEARSPGPGQGATFRFTLATLPDPNEQSPDNSPDDITGGLLRILVVEDNVDVAESLRDLLQTFGYSVELAYSGTEGVEKARHNPPQIILCDIGLPGKDGYEVAGELRTDPRTAGIRIAAVTGYGTEADRHRSRAAGFETHFTKPVHPPELLRWLESVAGEIN